jgi:XTP/dITP diphosphohydrolase
MQKILIATANRGKVVELREMLAALPIEIVSLADLESIEDVPETGSTFVENSSIKAIGYATQTGLHALADDSGLEVMALDGRPGVLSARYGGDDLNFSEKIEKLLDEVRETGSNDRRARFVCSIAFASPDGRILKATAGICDGHLADAPRGSGGFGYDPIFVPKGFDQTFGELSGDIKAGISHRARAFSQIIPYLRDFMAFLT